MREPKEPLVWCENVVRIFRTDDIEVQALQGLNLSVSEGEIVALVGASGSGKTTLLNVLSGMDTPSAGAVRVAGNNLLAMRRRQWTQYRRHTVGFVWQQARRNLLPYFTAAENIAVPMVLARRGNRRNRVNELLEMFGVGHCSDNLPAELSGGEQQRVAIATALANDPQVLLADEPTGELDSESTQQVLEALQLANHQFGVTVLIVTHDAGVSEHMNRTIRIRDGRTSTEVVRREEQDAQGGRSEVVEEFAVIDRVGRLQLPGDFVDALALRDRVRLSLEPDHVAVRPDHRRTRGKGHRPGRLPQEPHAEGRQSPTEEDDS